MRTASIRLDVTEEQSSQLSALQVAYADACNRLVPVVCEERLWNRVGLHNKTYTQLREQTPLGSQMCCNAIYSVCKAYKAQKELGRVRKDKDVPKIRFNCASVHFDKRTYTLRDNLIYLYTLSGRITVPLIFGEHQRKILAFGIPKEAELVLRKGRWFFNLVVEKTDPPLSISCETMGIDVGENTLAAHSLGKLFGGEKLRDKRDRHLSLRRRLQSNGSQSAKQKLRQVSGKENRRVKQVNHETSKAIVAAAKEANIGTIVMEDLTHIRDRIKAGKRVRARLHRWAWRQLQTFVEYKAQATGIQVKYVNPAYSSQTCSCCGCIGKRNKHRFECPHCGLLAHSDLNASRNLAGINGTAVPLRVSVNAPDVESQTLTLQ
ncbi:RNA-guided endonuclease InsQ/TnpB family protein [Arsenophonus sp.]|uniref:RNA-guided endonuclease InsQ/TnpB family protein n=1 Tax=Arsenophonus sp. TaxID=1872640 RepID=UPI00387959DD